MCCETVGYMKNILDAVKPKKPTAIPKMLMLIVKYYINLVNIFVKQHCFNYCASFTKFSGDICILCKTTALLFQVRYSGLVYVKQYICMLTHTTSQRIISEQFRLKSMLSPDKPVKENSIFLNKKAVCNFSGKYTRDIFSYAH